MSTIDRAALIEQAARASFMRPGMPLGHWERCNEDSREAFIEDTARSLPVIAKALLAPLRELHNEWSEFLTDPALTDGESAGVRLCRLELQIRLDAIEAEVQP